MIIVVDTNVLLSGLFFDGNPLNVLKTVVSGGNSAFATSSIVGEHIEVFKRLPSMARNSSHPIPNALNIFLGRLTIIKNVFQ